MQALLPCLAVFAALAIGPRAQEAAEKPAPTDPPEGHSHQSHAFNDGPRQAAYLMGTTGDVHFEVRTKDPQAQRFFDQGIGQLHGFWYFEAERTFRQVAALDPDCAMAYWGMCMANINNRERARGFIAEAVRRREHASPRGKQWIDAYAKFYQVTPKDAAKLDDGKARKLDAEPKRDDKKLARDLVRSLEEIVDRHPDDVEAKAFLCNRIWLNSRVGLAINSHQAVHALQDQIFARSPQHPAHHYRIHLWDREKAARAAPSAALCGGSAPGIAHMWHMSGHIYDKLHRHAEAAWQQEASARVDHAHMMRDRVMPHQIFNYGHNNEWLVRSLVLLGRVDEAYDLAVNMLSQPRHPKGNRLDRGGNIAGYGRKRLIEVLTTYERWDDLARHLESGLLAEAPDDAMRRERRRLLGTAHFARGDVAAGDAVIAAVEADLRAARDARQAEAEKAEAEARAKKQPDDKVLAAMTAALKKHMAKVKALEDERGLLRALRLAHGGDAKKALAELDGVRGVDGRDRAALHAAAGEHDKALELLGKELAKKPNSVPLRAHEVLVLHAAERTAKLRERFAELRRHAGRADLDAPLLQRLAPIAAELGLPADWRQPQEFPADFGERPDLASLGPFRWSPSQAPAFELPTPAGGQVRLADHGGKPLLLIFYLGFGCVHCVEQLQKFNPRAGEFTAAGIDILAIGTDTLAQMRESLGEGDGYAFPLLADPALTVFKRYRAFDDFEQLPLHGTFLIDGAGMVRWQDISYEPFTDVDFMLAEARRLLGAGAAGAQQGSR